MDTPSRPAARRAGHCGGHSHGALRGPSESPRTARAVIISETRSGLIAGPSGPPQLVTTVSPGQSLTRISINPEPDSVYAAADCHGSLASRRWWPGSHCQCTGTVSSTKPTCQWAAGRAVFDLQQHCACNWTLTLPVMASESQSELIAGPAPCAGPAGHSAPGLPGPSESRRPLMNPEPDSDYAAADCHGSSR